MIRLIHRRFCSLKPKPLRNWPFIARPALTQTLETALEGSTPAFYFINGGVGTGKSEALYRAAQKGNSSTRTSKNAVIVLDFEHLKINKSSEEVLGWVVQQMARQISHQLDSSLLLKLLLRTIPDFGERFQSFISNKPLWNHLTKSCRTVEDSWARVMTSESTVAEVIPQIRLSRTHQEELKLYVEFLRSIGVPVAVCLLHIERLGSSMGLLEPLMNPSFNVIVECNDPLMSIWTVCGDDNRKWTVIEVNDLPVEAVESVFVPSLLSDSVQVEALYKICGGRVGLLEKFFVPLTTIREQQKIKDMDQEQRYRAGKENRPSRDSKELQVDPLVYQRDVVLRDSLVEGVLNEETERFSVAMDKVINETVSLQSHRDSLHPMEYKVFVIESIKRIVDKINSQGSLPLPATLSPLDIAHPVILSMMESELLMIRWVPFPRIVAANPTVLVQAEAWFSSLLEDLSIPDRVSYNVIAARNRIHLDKQVDKLSA